jgi:hypothetical protein
MSTAKSLLTVNYKNSSATDFISSVADEEYYFFVSNHIDANSAARPFDNEQDTIVSSYQGMIFGKKIDDNDAILMIPRIDWQSNTIYATYDHRSASLYDENFYVVVNNGTEWDVFKCLENGNGNPSTVTPSRADVGVDSSDFFYPIDGYRWKFMYSIDSSTYNTFATTDHFPVVVDPVVSSKAIPGAIDVIQVTAPGTGYGNYFSGTLTVSDIRLNGDPKKYGITSPDIQTTNGYYDSCWLYISSGPGAGQYRMIDSYASNSTYSFVILSDEFDSTDPPQNGSTFEIMPSVSITGDGRETLPATARAIIDPASNTVSRIEMIERGQNYYYATASVQASGSVGVISQCGVVPIISPVKGHGSNPPTELGGHFVGLSVQLVGTEGNTIISDNDYSQMGIIKNPLFNEVDIALKNQNKDFFANEIVYKVTTKQLAGTVQTTVDDNNDLTKTLNVFGVKSPEIVDVGSTIIINWDTNWQIANVVSMSNTTIQIDSDALWNTSNNSANIFLATIHGEGFVSGFGVGSVILTDTTSNFTSNDTIIGSETGVKAQANVVTITGVSKTFDTFLQTYEYIGTVNQGTFVPDEVIFQTDDTSANGRFHSIEPDANTGNFIIYVTNQYGIFNTSADDPTQSNQIKGQTSGAIATLTNKYLPDLVYGSGEVVYIEYGDSITRSTEQTETFKLVLAF